MTTGEQIAKEQTLVPLEECVRLAVSYVSSANYAVVLASLLEYLDSD